MHEQLFVEIFIELTAQKNRQSNDHFQVQVGPHHPASGPPHCSGLSMQPNFFLIIEIQNCRIHSWQPTILQDAESMQNVTQDHKILH